MPKRGQEPTTKFKVDISELKAGITEANRQIRLANSEFKAAASGMDDWSKSADGISAKLKQLESILKSETTKLDLLKEQYKLVAAEQGENSKAAQELMIKINNQQASVNKVTSEIKKYSDTLDELESAADNAESDVQELSNATKDAADAAEDAGDGFTVLKGALADLVADGIRAAVDAFKDLLTAGDKAMGSFQAQTGASAKEMEQFNEQINDLYKSNFGEDIQDVADSMAQVAQSTKEVDPSKIRDLTENAIILRDTFDFEVNETMRAANMLMDQFGVTADEAFALIAQGAQNGLNKNGDLLDVINEYSVHYKQLGIGAEEMFNSLISGAESGAFSVDKLGDAMKEFGIRAKDGSKSSTEAFEILGYDAGEMFEIFNKGGESARELTWEIMTQLAYMDDGVEKTTAGVGLFGTMWEDLGAESIKAMVEMNEEVDKTKSTMDEIKDAKYSDIGSQWSEIGRIIKTDFIQPLANEALPKLKEGLTWVKDNVTTVTAAITGLTTAFIAFKAAAAITGVIDSFKKFKAAQEGATVAQWLLNTAMSANPVGLIIAAIAGLVAAFVLLWNKSDAFREFWINLWEKIKEGFLTAIEEVKIFFTETIPELFEKAYEKFEEFKETVGEFVAGVIEWFKQLPTKIYDVIVSILGHLLAWGIKLIMFAQTEVPKFVDKVIEWFATLPGRVWEWLLNAWDKITTWGAQMVTTGAEKASQFVENVINFIKNLPSRIWTWLTQTISKLITWGADMVTTGKEAAIDTIDGIIEAFVNLPSDLYKMGSDALTGFWDGLKSVGSRIKEWAENFFGDILKKAAEVLEIHSPSRAMKRIAAYTMQGFDEEAVARGKKVIQNVRDTFENVKLAASNALNGMGNNFNPAAGVANVVQKPTQIINFNQTNNSPKQLSRIEIYRQTKNLLNRGRVYV